MNFVVVGAQWGDEGKGKLIDILCENADITAAGLMQVRTASGKSFSFERWERGGEKQSSPMIRVAAGERFSVDLFYPRTSNEAGDPVEIQFPSGKWWSSK